MTDDARPAFPPPAPAGPAAAEPSRYAAFISYRHVEPDRKWAKWLHAALETYRVPKKLVEHRGITPRVGRVFRDEEELPASADLKQEIETALRDSRFLIVVCSPRTPESQWVNKEIVRFREMGRHDRILALLIEGEPGESFPIALREIRRRITDEKGLDRERIEEVEPLAADVRPSRSESPGHLSRMAKLRLLACVLGCRFDDLRQREQERRKRRNKYLSIASVALLAVMTVAGLIIRARVIRQQNAIQAAGLVKRLIDADTSRVSDDIDALASYRQWADPLLREENAKAAVNSRQKLRTSLALLPVDPGQVDFLYGRLLTAEPNEVPVLSDALFPHRQGLLDRLWSVVEKPERRRESTRLRAAAALAKYDPNGPKWAAASLLVVRDLVQENPIFLGQWSESFRPVKNQLLPALTAVFRDPQSERLAERNLATNLLAEYAADQPPVLADLLMDADEKQFAAIFPKFTVQAEDGLPILIGEIDQKLSPNAKDDAKENLAKRQANAAVALLKLNQPAKVWPLLRHSPDPRCRSYLIHRLSPLGADPTAIIRRLEVEPDVTVRRALILSLGEFGDQQLPPDERRLLTTKFQYLYRTATDPGLHAAVEWLLRIWNQDAWLREVNEQWAKDDEQRSRMFKGLGEASTKPTPESPKWYVNGQGQTMVVIPGPVEFVMGSPVTEANREKDEPSHKVRIGRTFAIAAKPVTLEEYKRFAKDYTLNQERYTAHGNLPVVATNWYQAAEYCNWVSKQEGIPEDQWCYEPANVRATKLKEKHLSLTGYRLPTEAEMEYATRAGAVTSRYYGETEELLGKYGWYLKNSEEKTWPVGSKKPNDFGFFDVHGNVWCWCQEPYGPYPDAKGNQASTDGEQYLDISSTTSRALRGGSFLNLASGVRCAYRADVVPSDQSGSFGFRAARTLPLVPFTSPAVGGANLK